MAAQSSQKDIWDKVDIIVKGLSAILVSGFIGFYAVFVQEANRLEETARQEANRIEETKRQEENRKVQTLIQLINSREESDADLRGRMFDTLLKNFFNKGDPESQIVALEMIGLNFRNTLQIKPMFNQLDRQLTRDLLENPENQTLSQQRAMLRKAARAIIRDQLTQIDIANDGDVCQLKLNFFTDKVPKFADCFASHAFRLVYTGSDSVRIQAYKPPEIDLNLNPQQQVPDQNNMVPQGGSFSVTYYDMPMSDYTQLSGGALYYSLVLLDVKNGEAELAVAVLPPIDYSSRKAYQFDQMVDEWIHEPY